MVVAYCPTLSDVSSLSSSCEEAGVALIACHQSGLGSCSFLHYPSPFEYEKETGKDKTEPDACSYASWSDVEGGDWSQYRTRFDKGKYGVREELVRWLVAGSEDEEEAKARMKDKGVPDYFDAGSLKKALEGGQLEVPAVSAVVGGLLAMEIVKALSRKVRTIELLREKGYSFLTLTLDARTHARRRPGYACQQLPVL